MTEIEQLENDIEKTKGYIEDRVRIINTLEELSAKKQKEIDTQKLMLTGYERRLERQLDQLDFEKRIKTNQPITKDDVEHLTWMYARLITVHGENNNYDYMNRMKQILLKLESNL